MAEKIKVGLIRSDSNDRCASPSSSSALELLAEIEKDNKQEKLQHQNSLKNATEMINEIDQGLDVLSMEAITMDSENEETKPTKPITPASATDEATAIATITIKAHLTRCTSTPRCRASDSPNNMASS